MPDRRSTRMIGDLHISSGGAYKVEVRQNEDGFQKYRYIDQDSGLRGPWHAGPVEIDVTERMRDMANEYGESPMMSEASMQGSIRDPWQTPVADLARSVEGTVRFYNGLLEEIGIEADIDEIAVMFNHRSEMWGWLQGAVAEENVRIFNHATDHVETSPIQSRYDVEYTFLESSALPWRIEAMLLTGGHSPLHSAIQKNRVGGMHTVHASFKCHTGREFRQAWEILSEEGECAQACVSTYGRFGYWQFDEDTNGLYLKPRLNERDAR